MILYFYGYEMYKAEVTRFINSINKADIESESLSCVDQLVRNWMDGKILTDALLIELREYANDAWKKKMFIDQHDEYIVIDGIRTRVIGSIYELVSIEELLNLLYDKLKDVDKKLLTHVYREDMSDVKRNAHEQMSLAAMLKNQNKGFNIYSLLMQYYSAIDTVITQCRSHAESFATEAEQRLENRYFGWCKAAINKIIKNKK